MNEQIINGLGAQDEQKTNVEGAYENGNNYENGSFLKALTKELKNKNILQYSLPTAKLSDLKKEGYLFSNIKSQRPVNVNHVKALVKSLKDDGVTHFSAKGIAVPAVIALQKGVELVDADTGNAINLDTSGIENYLLIIDMQHRFAACSMKEGLDMTVIISDCPDDPVNLVLRHNKDQKGWDSSDFRRHYSQKEGKADVLKKATDEGELIFSGCSQKAYEYAMSGKKDIVRKSDAQKGILPVITDEQKEVGLDLLRFLRVIANDEQKARRLEVFSAIYSVKTELSNSVSGKAFSQSLLCYAMESGNDDPIKVMLSTIKSQDFDGFKNELMKAIKPYVKAHKTDIDTLYEGALERFNKTCAVSVADLGFKDAPLDVVLKVNAEKEARKAEAKKKQDELEAQLKALQKQVNDQKKAVKNLDFFEDDNQK